ncbi:MAG: glycosyltransferase [Solirubrobacterales bacterium]
MTVTDGANTAAGVPGGRVAIVHDQLLRMGGAERVVVAMHRIWPRAPIYSSLVDREGLAPDLATADLRETRLGAIPGARTRHQWLLPFYDTAFRALDLSDRDLVISSAAMFAKSVQAPEGAVHICYCHTPVRYLWETRDSHIAALPQPWPVRWAVRAMTPELRRRDRRAMDGVDVVLANSRYIASLIKRHYGRTATVVHPPVDVEAFAGAPGAGDHLLVLGRLLPYKRIDLAIAAANRRREPLLVVGDGPDRGRLEALAGPTVRFCGWVTEQRKRELVRHARALLVPGIEDFGIATVEALAAGTPVIALDKGGSAEIVIDGRTGVLFSEQSAAGLVAALEGFDPGSFDPDVLRESARRFDEPSFRQRLLSVVAAACAGP